MKKTILSPFIQMIWEIVSDPQTDHIINWKPNGTSFCILNPTLFAEDILTTRFKHGNISSFVRQLNMYSFHKNKANPKDLEFYHKLFRRDAKQILVGIKRKPSETDQQEGEELLRKFLAAKEPFTSFSPNKSETSDHMHFQQKEQSTSASHYPPELLFLHSANYPYHSFTLADHSNDCANNLLLRNLKQAEDWKRRDEIDILCDRKMENMENIEGRKTARKITNIILISCPTEI